MTLPFDETVKNKFTANQGGALLCPAKKAAAPRQLLSACRKILFSPLPLFSELLQVLKILDFNGAGNLS